MLSNVLITREDLQLAMEFPGKISLDVKPVVTTLINHEYCFRHFSKPWYNHTSLESQYIYIASGYEGNNREVVLEMRSSGL
jgi:hypothetical protein